MSNVLDDVLNVEDGSIYEASLQNDISPRKQDDSEQFAKSVESKNQNMTLDKEKKKKLDIYFNSALFKGL